MGKIFPNAEIFKYTRVIAGGDSINSRKLTAAGTQVLRKFNAKKICVIINEREA